MISETGLPLGVYFFFFSFLFLKLLAENVGSLISVRSEEAQEQCYVCSICLGPDSGMAACVWDF